MWYCNGYFKEKPIEQVTEYKYLGDIVKAVEHDRQDIFSTNYIYICDRAKIALFLDLREVRNIDHLSPKIMFDTFNLIFW